MSKGEVLALAEDYFPLEAAVLKAAAFDDERPGRSPLRVADSNWNMKEPGIPATCTLDRAFSRFAREVEDLESVCLYNDRLTKGPHTQVGASDSETTLVEDAERLILLSNKRSLSVSVPKTSANGFDIHDSVLCEFPILWTDSLLSDTNARKESRTRLAQAEEKLQSIQETCDEALCRAADLWKESGSLREALEQKDLECRAQAQEIQELREAVFLQSRREDDAAQSAEANKAESDNYHKQMNLALQEQLIQERSRREKLERDMQGDKEELVSMKQAVESISRQLSTLQRQAHMHKMQIKENCVSEKLAQEDKLMRTLDGFEKAFNTILSGCDLWDVAKSTSSTAHRNLSAEIGTHNYSAERHAEWDSVSPNASQHFRGEHAAMQGFGLPKTSRAGDIGAKEELRAPAEGRGGGRLGTGARHAFQLEARASRSEQIRRLPVPAPELLGNCGGS